MRKKLREVLRNNFMLLVTSTMICILNVIGLSLSYEVKSQKELITYLKEDNEALTKENQDLEELVDTQESEYTALYNEYLNGLYDLKMTNAELEERILDLSTCTLPVYKYTKSEIQLLAKCVQAEAGEKNYESQKMITKVILNRVNSGRFPNTIKEVIYQKRGKIPQFSVAYNGALDKQDLKMETLANVYSVLLFDYDMPDSVQYFYATFVKENWVNKLTPYKTVQGTTFAYSRD